MTTPRIASCLAALTAVAVSAQVAAQTAPPAQPVPQPPPGFEQAPPPAAQPAPPPGYAPGYPPPYPPPGYPPPGYPPPGYAPPGYYPPPGYPAAPPTALMDPDNPPPGYHTESRARSGLLIGGIVMFGVSYGLSAAGGAAAAGDNNDELEPLLIPVAGPFITLSTAGVFERSNHSLVTLGNIFGAIGLILDGVIQVGGVALIVVGLAARKSVVVRDKADDAGTLRPTIGLGPGSATARWSF